MNVPRISIKHSSLRHCIVILRSRKSWLNQRTPAYPIVKRSLTRRERDSTSNHVSDILEEQVKIKFKRA